MCFLSNIKFIHEGFSKRTYQKRAEFSRFIGTHAGNFAGQTWLLMIKHEVIRPQFLALALVDSR